MQSWSEQGVLARMERIARLLEDGLLFLLLSSMILVASAQIVLRNVFDSGIIWADGVVRILVLWLALVGAIAASRDDRQIRIDLLSRYLPERSGLAVRAAMDAITVAVCVVLAWTSWEYVELFGEDRMLGGAIAAKFVQIILPVSFAVIAYRYMLLMLKHAWRAIRGDRT